MKSAVGIYIPIVGHVVKNVYGKLVTPIWRVLTTVVSITWKSCHSPAIIVGPGYEPFTRSIDFGVPNGDLVCSDITRL